MRGRRATAQHAIAEVPGVRHVRARAQRRREVRHIAHRVGLSLAALKPLIGTSVMVTAVVATTLPALFVAVTVAV